GPGRGAQNITWFGSIHQSLKRRRGNATFRFYDGPPFATGLPHYGHLLAGTIKDVIPRYQTMRGHAVERRFGWDCHGLPIENMIEKENNITSHQQIKEMGIAAFNGLCRASVQRYAKEWKQTVERMGRFVDMDHDYRTMDPEFMESIWWVFAELHRKDLIYEGSKPMHICPRCATPLSNFEVGQGYADRTDMSVIMTFPLKDDPKTVLLAWTTTPWSLPGNFWLAVGKKITYAKVREGDTTYILAEKLVETVFKGREYEVIGTIAAKELIGKSYEPLFPYFVGTVLPSTEDTKKPQTYGERVFKVITNDAVEVSDAEGTGIVHLTSSTGEDSNAVAVAEKVDVLPHIRIDGTFIEAVKDLQGMNAKPEGKDPMATDKKVIELLKARGREFSHYTINHSYPHCWRCDSPLLPYTTSSWFVSVEKIKKDLLANNEKTRWVPDHVRTRRFGNWLENARDWAISRNRYWGTPLPIWRLPKATHDSRLTTHDTEVLGSQDDLMSKCQIRFTKVTMLRHAESEGNTIPVYQGNVPGTSLTKRGKEQAQAAANFLCKSPIINCQSQIPTVIYASPLARAQQTAAILAKKTGAQVITDDRLREVSFGDYEGKHIDFSDLTFVKERRAHKLDSGKPESIYHFDGMETWASVQERIASFLREILPRHRSEHIAIVTHADPIMNMRAFFSGTDPVKLSHQPYPQFSSPESYFWDHDHEAALDLHRETVDAIAWPGSEVKGQSVDVTLVRHGETTLNVQDKGNGWTDDHLTDRGREQAKATAKKLKKEKFDAIICSDLPRAKETADIIACELGLPVSGAWLELREKHSGIWEGMPLKDILADHPPIDPAFLTMAFHHATPEGDAETLSAFMNRADNVRRKLLREFPGKRVLVVTHGGMIRALRTLTENLTFREAAGLNPSNAEVYSLPLHPLMERIPEVLDCWFESGSMPYAQQHYPFAFQSGEGSPFLPWRKGQGDGGALPPGFPADFIAEGIDQTRGWFYTLSVLSTALFNEPAFRNCIVNGIVLAEDGKKMSKRLKNYPEPTEVAERHGADAVRFSLMRSPAVRGEDLRFSEKLVEETVRSVILPLWNTYSFFVTYANAAGWKPTEIRRKSTHPLDRWIRSEIQDLVNRMTLQLDGYDLSATCAELGDTIDALTNWYVRLSRRRFAGKGIIEAEEASGDVERGEQHDALVTLYDVLLTLSQVLAPFCPFITDAIYLNLVSEEHGSIHLTDWPETRSLTQEESAMIAKHTFLRLVVSLGNSIRSKNKIKTRQPLARVTVAVPRNAKGDFALTNEERALLLQELNVKEIALADDPGKLAQIIALVDARKVGSRLGKQVQEVIAAGKRGDFTQQEDGTVLILDEILTAAEVQIQYRGAEGTDVAAEGGIVVSLDTRITPELECEGSARDLIREIQKLRKDSGLAFTDRIALSVGGLDDVMESFKGAIAEETRATWKTNEGKSFDVEIEGKKVTITFEKL
ncbi:MAG: isoleucyl-tRNA synthetase, partial [Candidatus Peregrinibacteria bacterium Greene0416_62]